MSTKTYRQSKYQMHQRKVFKIETNHLYKQFISNGKSLKRKFIISSILPLKFKLITLLSDSNFGQNLAFSIHASFRTQRLTSTDMEKNGRFVKILFHASNPLIFKKISVSTKSQSKNENKELQRLRLRFVSSTFSDECVNDMVIRKLYPNC